MSTKRTRLEGRGFTLLEMMLVLVIIGILATVAVIAVGGQGKQGRITATMGTLKTVDTTVKSYQLAKGSYPANLDALVPGYLDKKPKDAWKRELVYYVPSPDGKPFALISMGDDGQVGTADDINVWTMGDAEENP